MRQVIEVGKVHFVIGAGDGDKWNKFHLEYSEDGNGWKKAGSFEGNGSQDVIDVDLYGAKARYVRMVNDETIGKWIKFSELRVEEAKLSSDYTYTNAASLDNITNEVEELAIGLVPQASITLGDGEYIEIRLAGVRDIESILAEVTNKEELSLQYSINEEEWTDLQWPGGKEEVKGKYIRIINQSGTERTFGLNRFKVNLQGPRSIKFLETTMGISDAYGEDDSRRTGTLNNLFDGDFKTETKFCDYPLKDGYILYDLGQERNIFKIRAYTIDRHYDYLRDGIIQISNDKENWTDVVTIGDGEENDNRDVQATDGWTHDPQRPGNYYYEGTTDPTKARYLRILFTAV